MRTQTEILDLIDKTFPNRVYVCVDAPEEKRFLMQFFTNPPRMTLLTSVYGSTEEECREKAIPLFGKTVVKLLAVDNRKAKPKYPDTPEGRLEEVVDRLAEIFSAFVSEITSEELDT